MFLDILHGSRLHSNTYNIKLVVALEDTLQIKIEKEIGAHQVLLRIQKVIKVGLFSSSYYQIEISPLAIVPKKIQEE